MVLTAPTSAPPFIPYRKLIEIDYDSLDFDPYEPVEKPDAMLQHDEQSEMFTQIRAHFARFGKRPDVFVSYDTNICWDPANLRYHISPDVYIAFGVDAKAIRKRLIYVPQEVGKPPDFAMEIASPSTADNDVENKPRIYEENVKAKELWMLDPSGGDYYKFPLKGLKLVDGKYQEIELTREPDGVLKGYSEVLRLSLAWLDGFPRLYDHASGKYLENQEEVTERADTAEAERDAQKERADAAEAARDTAEVRADAAEAQLDITEMRLESEIKARSDAQSQLESQQAENRRLQNLINQLQQNP